MSDDGYMYSVGGLCLFLIFRLSNNADTDGNA